MDDCMGRKTATGILFTRGGCSITLSEQKHHDRNIRCCSRVRCCASLYSMKGTNMAEENSSIRPGSSRSLLLKPRRPNEDVEAASSHIQGDNNKLKRSDRSLDVKDLDSQRRLRKKEKSHAVSFRPLVEAAKVCRLSENATGEVRSCRMKLSSRESSKVTRKTRYRRNENSNTDGSNLLVPLHAWQDMPSISDQGLNNLKQTDTSGVLPSGFDSADSEIGRLVDEERKRSFRRRGSSYMGKSVITSMNGANSASSSAGTFGPSTSLSEHLASHQIPRRSRNISIRTRQAPINNTRRVLGQVYEPILVRNSAAISRQSPSESGAVPQSSSRSSRECHTSHRNLHGQSRYVTQNAHHRLIDETVAHHIPMLDDTSEDSYSYLNLNAATVAEVLLELERIEQDEGFSLLGNHLILESLSFPDQYRDMRMDIDNMTYEELLALGERVGTVSTALTEEALPRCLKRGNYMLAPSTTEFSDGDVKCSICQNFCCAYLHSIVESKDGRVGLSKREEYVVGDELGKLVCEHFYHVACIHQWLRLKNWCPICKASVSPIS